MTLQIHGKRTEYLISVPVTTVHPNGKHNYISPSGRIAQNSSSIDGGDHSRLTECSTVAQFQRKVKTEASCTHRKPCKRNFTASYETS